MPANKFSAEDLAELDKLDKDIASLENALKGSEADLALLLGSSLPPPAGTAADIVSLGKSIGTGDWGGAFWDAIGLVPVVGDVAKGAVKGTKLANKIADIKKAVKTAREKLAARRKAAQEKAQKKCDETKKAQTSKDNDKAAAENCGKGDCSKRDDNKIKKENPCLHLRSGNGKGPYRGGAHSGTSKPTNDNKDSHHMPAKDASPLPAKEGPAIQMDPKDHAKTSSNGQMPGSVEYREKIAEMIEAGKWNEAMAMEIKDVRRVAGKAGNVKKYNEAMKEMLNYYKCLKNHGLVK